MNRIKGLDTLRAFAVIFVVRIHWGPIFYPPETVGYFIQTFFPDGLTGVYLFFVLSGYLITGILLKARQDNHGGNNLSVIKNFFLRRALRIFPLYYLLITILYFSFPDIKGHFTYLLCYATNFFCYKANSWNASSATHTWTLGIEEQFYIVWPWLMLWVKEKHLKYVFTGAIITGIVSTYYVLQTHIAPFLPFNCFDAFGIGGFYAYARMNKERCRKFERTIKLLAPWLIAVYIFYKAYPYTGFTDGMFMLKTVDSFICVWLIILVVNNKSEWTRKYLLENKVLNFIGKISYGIYIFHPYFWHTHTYVISFINDRIVHQPLLHDLLISAQAVYIYDLTMLITLCYLSYTFFETPILSLKRFFNYAKPGKIKEEAAEKESTPVTVNIN